MLSQVTGTVNHAHQSPYTEHISLTGLSSFLADRGNRFAEPLCQEFQEEELGKSK